MSDHDDLESIRESFDPRLIEALYRNFTDKYIAIQELLDNCVDDIVEGDTLNVGINYNLETQVLEIKNVGGRGMTIDNIRKFFSWGTSDKVNSIGRYGQGGKAALGYLGKGFNIKSHPRGATDGFIVRVDDWQDRKNGFKEFAIEPFPTTESRGMVSIEIHGLKQPIDIRTLRNRIADIYKPLIANHRISFVLNGETVACRMPVYDEGTYTIFNIPLNHDGTPYKLFGEYGIVSDSNSPRGGFNIYQFGRKIAGKEYFGLPDPSKKWSAEKLYGELYLEFEFPLLMNKTDLERDSTIWKRIVKLMSQEINPILKSVVDPRAPSKTEMVSIEKITKKLKHQDEEQRAEISLANYGPMNLFKLRDKDGTQELLVNMDHTAYKKWSKNKDLYNIMVYALYDASSQLSKTDAAKFQHAFSESLKKYCDKLID